MRVIVAAGTPGFIGGGATELAISVERALLEAGHEVELLFVQSYEDTTRILPQLAGMRVHDYSDEADHLIALRWPAHFLRHDRKSVWCLHEYRTLFDLAGWLGDMGALQGGDAQRARLLARWELTALSEARNVFTNSQVVSDRLARSLNGFPSQVIEPPYPRELPEPAPFEATRNVLQLGRVSPIKRQDLAIRALAASGGDWHLTIAGVPEPLEYGRALREMVDELGVGDRVDLRLGWIDEDEKLALLARSAVVLNLAFAEDSYSYVTYEGWAAARPVVTTSDTEGIAHAVATARAGIVADPDPESLGNAVRALLADPVRAAEEGARGRDWVLTKGTTWASAIERLLA